MKMDEFLKTFSAREETIIRYRFGIGVAKLTDNEIVGTINRYSKWFNATQLRKHYQFLTLAVNDKTRREYGVTFNFKTGVVTFTDAVMKAEFELSVIVADIINEELRDGF